MKLGVSLYHFAQSVYEALLRLGARLFYLWAEYMPIVCDKVATGIK